MFDLDGERVARSARDLKSIAILVGPARAGMGVVIDVAARAEQLTGHRTFGIAVSGSTAQRLGQDSPALAGQTLTLDARVQHGQLSVDEHMTIYFDEAGMVTLIV